MGGLVVTTVVGAALLGCAGCTEKTEFYCDVPADCPSGMCDVDDHVCLPAIDAAADAAADDGNPDAAPTACELAGGKIVFKTDRDGDNEIAMMLADGSAFELLTDNVYNDRSPQWSPDGTKIAWLGAPIG